VSTEGLTHLGWTRHPSARGSSPAPRPLVQSAGSVRGRGLGRRALPKQTTASLAGGVTTERGQEQHGTMGSARAGCDRLA
jgi:hypothetical protein